MSIALSTQSYSFEGSSAALEMKANAATRILLRLSGSSPWLVRRGRRTGNNSIISCLKKHSHIRLRFIICPLVLELYRSHCCMDRPDDAVELARELRRAQRVVDWTQVAHPDDIDDVALWRDVKQPFQKRQGDAQKNLQENMASLPTECLIGNALDGTWCIGSSVSTLYGSFPRTDAIADSPLCPFRSSLSRVSPFFNRSTMGAELVALRSGCWRLLLRKEMNAFEGTNFNYAFTVLDDTPFGRAS